MTPPHQREGTQRRRRLLARLIGLNMLGLIILAGGFLVLSNRGNFLPMPISRALKHRRALLPVH